MRDSSVPPTKVNRENTETFWRLWNLFFPQLTKQVTLFWYHKSVNSPCSIRKYTRYLARWIGVYNDRYFSSYWRYLGVIISCSYGCFQIHFNIQFSIGKYGISLVLKWARENQPKSQKATNYIWSFHCSRNVRFPLPGYPASTDSKSDCNNYVFVIVKICDFHFGENWRSSFFT